MSGALGARFRFWFGFADPVDRGAYFRNGAALMLCKYAVDAAAIGLATGRFWTPLDYLNPVWSLREQTLRLGPTWVVVALTAWALPFLWIGVSLTTRRAVDAGWSAWSGLLFFVPVVNYIQMIVLSVAPSRSRGGRPWQRAIPAPVVDERLRSAMLGIAAGLAVAIPTVLVSVFVAKSYANALFLGTPFTLGAIAAHVHNSGHPRTLGETLQVAMAAVTLACGTVVLFAIEGVVCVAMASPIAVGLAGLGAILGRTIALRTTEPPAHAGMAVLVLPLLALLDGRGAPAPVHEVVSVIEIEAPPERVWRNVVAFAELPPPTEWLFRAGVAAPLRARIDGTGAGAVRYCEFTTGTFVEPISRWDAPRALDFDITAQPAPLHELSPYRSVHATHLNGYFRAVRGGFRLIALPGGRTRLEGRTAYEVEMYPQVYWSLYAGAIMEAIHRRVLRHIKRLAEVADPVISRQKSIAALALRSHSEEWAR